MYALGFPRNYFQGSGVLNRIGELISPLGETPLVLSDGVVYDIVGKRVEKSILDQEMRFEFVQFGGECCEPEIERIATICRASDVDMVVGIGGGKTLDTSKAVAVELELPMVMVPTIASNDASTSRVIPIYSETGEFIKPTFMPANPDTIIVDTHVIAQAPSRFLVAGMGDALATKFEADQCEAKGVDNFFHGLRCRAALALADTCCDLIMKYGVLAKQAVEQKCVTTAVERIVEANVLLSGLGFESCGVAAAHMMEQGFSQLEETHAYFHGEKVAFGLLVQFVLENRDEPFFTNMLSLFLELGLPMTLEDIGITELTDKKLDIILTCACRPEGRMPNMNLHLTNQLVGDALKVADTLGRAFKDKNIRAA